MSMYMIMSIQTKNNIASRSAYIVLGVFCLHPLALHTLMSCWVVLGLGKRGLGVRVRLRLACV